MDLKKVTLAGGGVTTIVGAGAGTFFLTQNKTTIKDRLISKNIKLISSDAEYLPAYKEYQDEKDFKDLIKDGNSAAGTWKEQQWADALKKWCEKNLVLKSAENQENVEKYCTKTPLTIKERIEKRGKRRAVNWDEKISSLGYLFVTDFLIEKGEILNASDQPAIKGALVKWCDDSIETKLNQTTSDEIWKKVQKYCLESQ